MRDDAKLDALQQALLTALTTDSDVRQATHDLAPEWSEQMTDEAIAIARKLAKRWCRTQSDDRG